MSVNNKLIDIEKLSRYHENLKEVLNTKEAAGEAAKAEAAAKKYADEEIAKLSFDEAGAAGEAYEAAKEYADDLVKNEDGSVKFDDKGAAATAEQNAKDYADGLAGNYDAAGTAAGLNAAMNERVVKLEAIDHDKIVADAIAAVVDGAESDFDTLKEVADWINNDKTGAAALQVAVSEHGEAIEGLTNDKQDNITDLETIRTGAAAGAVAEQNAKDYADGLAGNYDASGSAAIAEQNAKDYATGLVMDGENVRFDAAGAAADALDDAKEYADDLVKNEDGSVKFDDKGAAAQALADAKADAAGLYQVKGDYLIPSDLSFATDGDIDGLFA